MADLIDELKQNNLTPLLWQSLMGVEVETQRIDEDGELSHEPYPESLGSRQFHPNLQTDFGETQTEWITDPFIDDHQLMTELQAIRAVFVREMTSSDRLWLLSMPPALTHEDRLFVRNHFGRPNYQHYRDYLDGKFGIAHGLTTGVHINFSLAPDLVAALAQVEHVSVAKVSNRLYWRVLQNFLKQRWLLTYLFGASPIAEKGYFSQMPSELSHPVRSIRNSAVGFNNGGRTAISYVSLQQHVSDLQTAINRGELYAQMEFYGPVRIKGQANLNDYETNGIKYLEFRVFDTNPFTPLGIDEQEVDFMRALLTYSLVTVIDGSTIDQELAAAAELNNAVAMQQPTEALSNRSAAEQLMSDMTRVLTGLGAPGKLIQAIKVYQTQLDQPETTLAARLTNKLSDGSLTSMMRALANERYQTASTSTISTKPLLPGTPFTPEMQALLAAGLKAGLHIHWPNTSDSTVTFSDGEHTRTFSPTDTQLDTNMTQLFRVFPALKNNGKFGSNPG